MPQEYFGEYVTFSARQFYGELWEIFGKDPEKINGNELAHYRSIIVKIAGLLERKNVQCMKRMVDGLKEEGWIPKN